MIAKFGCEGYSKWFSNDGAFVWKPCKVLSYEEAEERFRIKWEGIDKEKLISRPNLIFKNEGFANYEAKLKTFEQFR